MKCLPVICFFLLPCLSKAQQLPDSVTASPEKFAAYLQHKYTESPDRLRALYSWITYHIEYSKDSAMYFNWNAGQENKINATLRRRKGVCENYAALLADIAGRLAIPAFVVHGYPAYANENKDYSHSWVAIQDKDEWYLCDPTWDAQSATEKYYMQPPSEFIRTHIPFDPLWQLLERPQHYTVAGKFMYKDSVSSFLQMDSLQQFLASERRINNSGYQNIMTKNSQRQNQMNIAIISGEEDNKFYNAAVEDLNNANKYLNAFVQYRNQQFTPVKTDKEIKDMLLPIEPLLKKATASLNSMGKLRDNFQYDPETILERINALDKKMKTQTAFLTRYFETAPSDRMKLFYQ